MNLDFKNSGYFVKQHFLNHSQINRLSLITEIFHHSWVEANIGFYEERAINSAYLTSQKHLNEEQRISLLQFIGSNQLMEQVYSIIPKDPAFMNTQLFFNPVNPEQKNYWHRDIQYDLDLEQQKAALSGPQALHFRVALKDEPGIELVPGSHMNWDTQEELDVRLEQNGKKSHHNLSTGKTIPLKAGDLLIFSAKMIHRGLYGLDRFSLDVLYCDSNKELLKYAEPNCLPNEEQLKLIEDPTAFMNTAKIINSL
ncbi:phytanoyl-CoA dioxygenase family protein [Kangiella sp. HZ709]|uniref:phytanoyl-CoA dioxygenase family protein n=1 Tax=Kangiella sp. HZ709 TaxID=2666328 RepID=UPI0012AF7AC2|nr:phytanoyl-CoA dioxygenase family protein [Kangiella sp. HZ709]MRX28329.1 phytanoyl-CoA dioxygenase [Kangiella sp. HZ709]